MSIPSHIEQKGRNNRSPRLGSNRELHQQVLRMMATLAIQMPCKTASSIQRGWIKEQPRGYQVLYGLGSSNGGAVEVHEILPHQARASTNDSGLPLVHGYAAKH